MDNMDELQENVEGSQRDHDRLVRMEEILKQVHTWCFNHDKHHQTRTDNDRKIMIGLIISLILALLALKGI